MFHLYYIYIVKPKTKLEESKIKATHNLGCILIPILPYYLVCQKKIYYVSIYSIPGCPAESSRILQYASQHAFLAEDTSHRLSAQESTDRWQLIDRWQHIQV